MAHFSSLSGNAIKRRLSILGEITKMYIQNQEINLGISCEMWIMNNEIIKEEIKRHRQQNYFPSPLNKTKKKPHSN